MTVVLIGLRHTGGIAVADEDNSLVSRRRKNPAFEPMTEFIGYSNNFGMISELTGSDWSGRNRLARRFGMQQELRCAPIEQQERQKQERNGTRLPESFHLAMKPKSHELFNRKSQ